MSRRTRNVIIGGIVLVVAMAATAFVVLDRRHPIEEPLDYGVLVTIVVATEEIPANQLLDPLIEEGLFDVMRVPEEALVEGAVTDVRDLYGMRTTTVIFANEQISTVRLTTFAP